MVSNGLISSLGSSLRRSRVMKTSMLLLSRSSVFLVHALAQLGAREHLAGAEHEVLEQAVFVGREVDGLVVHAHRLPPRVERDGAADELRRGPAARPAQQRQQARVHFFEVKRLRDVVVGAGFEAFDLVLPAIAGGQDQDGERSCSSRAAGG